MSQIRSNLLKWTVETKSAMASLSRLSWLFRTVLLGQAQKSKFRVSFWTRKWPMTFGFKRDARQSQEKKNIRLERDSNPIMASAICW